VREPAFGMRAYSVPEMFAEDLKRDNFAFADNMSVLLTHLSEVIRNNLPQLLSYKDMKALLERQDPEYRKLADEICTSHITYPGLQAVLKLLLAERVSIRNLHLIIEAIAEIAPHVRRTEQIVEHVRIRMAQQICGDLSEGGVLKVLRLGNRWDLAFHQSLKRDAKGEVREFDIDPRQLEEFGQDATKAIK
jgi:flagellar biosynthesis protein FlhA